MYIHNNIGFDTNIKVLVNDKIELLQDFTILRDDDIKQEVSTRLLLTTCKSEIQMEQKLYNVLHGSETLEDLLARDDAVIKTTGAETFARSITTLLWEYSKYNNPEELLAYIMQKINKFSTLKKVVFTYYNMELEEEEMINTLRKELKI